MAARLADRGVSGESRPENVKAQETEGLSEVGTTRASHSRF